MSLRWGVLVVAWGLLVAATPVDQLPRSKVGLLQTASKARDAGNDARQLEVSDISERIFDDSNEKSNFEATKGKMDRITSQSVPMLERLESCKNTTHGSCGEGLKLFTVWTTPSAGWNNKFTYSVDSAFFNHPKAKVTIYSSSLPSDFLDEFVKLGYDAHVEKLNLRERSEGTPLLPWAEKLSEWKDGPFYYAHLSDAMRLVVLYQEGGVYFDTDVVFVRPFDTLHNVIGWEDVDSLCNAVMAFEKGNPYIRDVLKLFTDHYVKDDWAANGPAVLTDVFNRHTHPDSIVHPLPREAFYFVSWGDINLYFDKQLASETASDMEILRRSAFALHLWNSRSHDLVVHPHSLVASLFRSYCVYCKPLKSLSESHSEGNA